MHNSRAFTLVEIMVVVMILSILFLALYMGVQPYLGRSRDTKRVTSMLQYSTILETYDKTFDTFPSNYGQLGIATHTGYCLSELPTRGDVASLGSEGHFSFFGSGTSTYPPIDPLPGRMISPCAMDRSFLYSRLDYSIGKEKQLVIIAAKLEMKTSGNYGTGSDLLNKVKYQNIIDAKKGSIPTTATDQLFVVTMLH